MSYTKPAELDRNICPRGHRRGVAIYEDPATHKLIVTPCDVCDRARRERWNSKRRRRPDRVKAASDGQPIQSQR